VGPPHRVCPRYIIRSGNWSPPKQRAGGGVHYLVGNFPFFWSPKSPGTLFYLWGDALFGRRVYPVPWTAAWINCWFCCCLFYLQAPFLPFSRGGCIDPTPHPHHAPASSIGRSPPPKPHTSLTPFPLGTERSCPPTAGRRLAAAPCCVPSLPGGRSTPHADSFCIW